jgi:hypothetical protein
MFCDPVNLPGHFRVFRLEVKPALFIESNRSIVDIFEELHCSLRSPEPVQVTSGGGLGASTALARRTTYCPSPRPPLYTSTVPQCISTKFFQAADRAFRIA